MMMKTLPNFDFTKNKIYKIVTKHAFFFKFAYRGGGGGGSDSEWSAELFGLINIISSNFDPATKERVDFFRVDRLDGVF